MLKSSPFKYFKKAPEIVRLTVMMYVRFPLSLRNVEDLLNERDIDISHISVHLWWNRFGPMFASEIRYKRAEGCDENRQKRTGKPFQRRFKEDEQHLRWSQFRHLGSDQMLPLVRDKVFLHFRTTVASGTAFAEIMKDAQLMIQKPGLLVKAFNIIHEPPLRGLLPERAGSYHKGFSGVSAICTPP